MGVELTCYWMLRHHLHKIHPFTMGAELTCYWMFDICTYGVFTLYGS